MKFNTAKKLVVALLVGALVFCGIALISGEDSPQSVTFGVGSVALIGVTAFVAAVGLKCPYCGERILKNVLKYKNCPHCGRNFESGLKGKKGR